MLQVDRPVLVEVGALLELLARQAEKQFAAGAFHLRRLHEHVAPRHRAQVVDDEVAHRPALILEQHVGELARRPVARGDFAPMQAPHAKVRLERDRAHARTFAHICFADAFTTSTASGSPLMSASR